MRTSVTLLFALLLLVCTPLFADEIPIGAGSVPESYTAAGNVVYFTALTKPLPAGGAQLWRTDGTPAGTRAVCDLKDKAMVTAGAEDGSLYFTQSDGIWKTDGTSAGTRLLLRGGVRLMTVIHGRLVFMSSSGELWSADVTSGEAVLLRKYESPKFPEKPLWVADADTVYFYGVSSGLRGLWRTDGTLGGTSYVNVSVPVMGAENDRLFLMNGVLYARVQIALWRFDPATGSAVVLAPAVTPEIAMGGGHIYFIVFNSQVGELWTSDGTVAGTAKLRSRVGPYDFDEIVVSGGRAFFRNRYLDSGELWTSDGTPDGTKLVTKMASVGLLVPFPGGVLFNGIEAFPPTSSLQLWRSDGTAAGTTRVVDIGPRTNDQNYTVFSSPIAFFPWRDLVLFAANDGVTGREPWRTDGTAAGTMRLANVLKEATIAGRVTDAQSSPVANARVEAYYLMFGNIPYLVQHAFTAADGTYELPGLAAGKYTLRTLNVSGATDEVYRGVSCCDMSKGTIVDVPEQTAVTGLDFHLGRGGRLSGKVTNKTTGAPLGGILLRITNANGTLLSLATTGADGRWISDAGLPPGQYRVRTNALLATAYSNSVYGGGDCLSICHLTDGTLITVTGTETVTGIDLQMLPFGVIRGVFKDAITGMPYANVYMVVWVNDGSGGYLADFVVQPDGSFEVPAFQGSYTISTTAASPETNPPYVIDLGWPDVPCANPNAPCPGAQNIVVTSGQETRTDFLLKRIGSSIDGHVVDAATGAPLDANVSLVNERGDSAGSVSTIKGTYVFSHLASGTYFVTASAAGHATAVYAVPLCFACTPRQGKPVFAGSSPASNIDFQLPRGGRITGRVTDAATGAPIANVVVTVSGGATARTAADGTFATSPDLSPDSHTIKFSPALPWEAAAYDSTRCYDGCADGAGKTVTVAAGQDLAITMTLRKLPQVAGRIVDAATKKPIARATVFLLGTPAAAVTDADGRYSLSADLHGSAIVDVSARGYGLTRLQGGALAADTVTPVDGELRLASAVSGRITDGMTGVPVWHATVTIEQGDRVLATFLTDTDGRYAFLPFVNTTPTTVRVQTSQYTEQSVTLTATNGAPIRYDFALRTIPRLVALAVTDTAGTPIAGVGVELYDDYGRFVLRSPSVSGPDGIVSVQVTGLNVSKVKTYNVAGYADVPCSGICDLGSGTIFFGGSAPQQIKLRRSGLSDVLPRSGVAAGGSLVTLTGTFPAGSTVTFGGQPATIVDASATKLTVRTPPHAEGEVDVAVQSSDGTVTRTRGFTYVAACAPVTAGMSQSSTGSDVLLRVTLNGGTGRIEWRTGDGTTAYVFRAVGDTFLVPATPAAYTAHVSAPCQDFDLVFHVGVNKEHSVRH